MERKRRSLWGSISTSEKADLLTDTEFLLYLLIIPHCDDEGRMQGKPKTVKNKTCPGRTWTAGRIEKMLYRLGEVGLIEYYSVNGSRYIQVTQWEEHQTFHGITREKSKYPTNNGLGTQPSLVKNSTNPGSKRSKEKISKEKIREEGGSTPPPTIKELCSLVINIPGWTRDDDADIKLFSGLLDLGMPVPLIKKTIEDLRVYQENPKKAYKNLRQTLRNWCKREFERRANEPTGRRVGYGKG